MTYIISSLLLFQQMISLSLQMEEQYVCVKFERALEVKQLKTCTMRFKHLPHTTQCKRRLFQRMRYIISSFDLEQNQPSSHHSSKKSLSLSPLPTASII